MDYRDRIRQRMTELGTKPTEVSRKARLGQTYVRDLLEGASPRIEKLESLAAVLETSLKWLLFGEGMEKAVQKPSNSVAPHYLREWMTAKNVSVRKLSQMVVDDTGESIWSASAWQHICSNKQSPTLRHLQAASRALDVPVNDLLSRDPKSSPIEQASGHDTSDAPEGGVFFTAEQIGSFIKSRREELGLTQVQFAELLGKSESAVKQMENGTNVKSWTGITAAAKILQITPNALLGFPKHVEALPTASALAAVLRPILLSQGADAEDASDIALRLIEAVEAARELSDGEPDHQTYSLAGRFAARKSGA